MKPVIGITGNHDDNAGSVCLKEYYIRSIQSAGGVPVILPPTYDEAIIARYLSICGGVLLSGGGDLDPFWWGEHPIKGLGQISPQRDFFEIQLTRLAIEQKKPLLGICRGCQVMNVAAGGSLFQDISGTFNHDQNAPREYPFHVIVIESGSKLASIIEEEIVRVNSFHHQAVQRPGTGLQFTAYAPDGTAEALEDPAQPFFIGVQWHPEGMTDVVSARLFKAFVASCTKAVSV